ncbi:MAG: hypothetical protein QM692_06765 [Thermomicrobiales bacterium]
MSEWVLLVYRVPTEPAAGRVSVWRHLKRMGGLYLQQCVCLFPALPEILRELDERAAAISELGGEYTLFDIPLLRPGDEERVIATFRDLRNKDYAEIIEECETKFLKEIEFEHFRQNYSYAESEEIRQDLDKIRRWQRRVIERDWFNADRRDEAEAWIARCADLLAEYEQEVYRRQSADVGGAFDLDLAPFGTPPADRPSPPAPDEATQTGDGEEHA